MTAFEQPAPRFVVQEDHGPLQEGRVTVSDLEWVQNRHRYQWSKERVHDELERRLHRAWTTAHERVHDQSLSCRLAAYTIALERTIDAIELRGF